MDYEIHPICNAKLRPPENWDQSGVPCGALPVHICELEGVPVMESFWRPSAEELEALNARGYVVLQVLSTSHPPVAIGVLP